MKQFLFALIALITLSAQAEIDWTRAQSYVCMESDNLIFNFELPETREHAPVALRNYSPATSCEWAPLASPPFPGWVPQIATCSFSFGPDAGQRVTLQGLLANGVFAGDVSAQVTDRGPTGDGQTRTNPCYFSPKPDLPTGFTVGN